MLVEEFLKPLGITQTDCAKRIGVPFHRLNEIVNGRRGISIDTALRLSKSTWNDAGLLAQPTARQ